MTIEALAVLDEQVNYRQAIRPNHQKGSFVGDDTDDHDFLFKARGKRTITVAIDNPTNQTLTWSLYGLHEADGAVGDPGSFEVDVSNTITAGNKGQVTNTAAYPFYLLRCSFASTPDSETVSVYVDLAGN